MEDSDITSCSTKKIYCGAIYTGELPDGVLTPIENNISSFKEDTIYDFLVDNDDTSMNCKKVSTEREQFQRAKKQNVVIDHYESVVPPPTNSHIKILEFEDCNNSDNKLGNDNFDGKERKQREEEVGGNQLTTQKDITHQEVTSTNICNQHTTINIYQDCSRFDCNNSDNDESTIDCVIFKSIGLGSRSIKCSNTQDNHPERLSNMKNQSLQQRLERSKNIKEMSYFKVCSYLIKIIELISLHKDISAGVDEETGMLNCDHDNYTSEEYHQCMNLIYTIGSNHTIEHNCDLKTPYGIELFWKPIIMGYCRIPLVENLLHLLNPFDAVAPLSRMLSCTLTGMFRQQRERQFLIVNLILDWLERKIPNELCRYRTEKEGFTLLHCAIYGSISLTTIPSDGGYSLKERWYSGWSCSERKELIDRLILIHESCNIKIYNSTILAFTDCYTGYTVEKSRYQRYLDRQITLPKILSDVIWTVMEGRIENWPSFIPGDLIRDHIGVSVLYQLVMEDCHDQLRRILPLIEHINCYTYDYKDRSFEPLIPKILRGAARRIRDKNVFTIFNIKDCTLGDLKSLTVSLQLLMKYGADPYLPIKYSYTKQYHTIQDYLQHYGYLYPGSRIEEFFRKQGVSFERINIVKYKEDDDIQQFHFNRDRTIRHLRSIYNDKRHHGPFRSWCKKYKYIKDPSKFRAAYDSLKEIYETFKYNLASNVESPYKLNLMFNKHDFVEDPWLTRLKEIFTDDIFVDCEFPTSEI